MDAANFVGTIPENYDRGLGPHIFEGYADDLVRRVAAVNPRRVLELAAGTGIVSRRLRDALGESSELIISDLNEPMLEVAREKFRNSEGVRFEQVDAMDLPYTDASFDVVTCQFGVMFFPDKTRSYREAKRVLKTDGQYVFNVWGSWDENPFARLIHELVAARFPENPPGFYKVPFSYHNPNDIRSDLKQAGFTRISIEEVRLTSAISSAELFARGLVFGNPLYQEILNLGGDAEEIVDEVAGAIENELGAEMPLQALAVAASV